MELLGWMYKYRGFLGPDKPLDFDEHRYLEPIYKDDCEEMDLLKAGQVGVSEYLLSWFIWSADVRKATGLYIFPTDGLVSDFSTARLGPAIEPEVSPYLAEIIISSHSTKAGRRGADRVGLKRVRDRFIYFRGGQVKPDSRAPQLKSIDADVLVLDEFDEMDPRAPVISMERLGHSNIAQVRKASTPTYSEVGIHAEYLQSDQRRWFVSCKSCGQKQDLRLEDMIIEFDDLQRPVAWHKDNAGNPFIACRRCGGEMDRLGHGEWVVAYPGRRVHGYHLSRLFAPHKPLMDIIEGLQSTNETKRQQIYNQGLGLPYSSPLAIKLTDDILNACRRDYGLTPSQGRGSKVYCGVDVGNLLHVVIREVFPDGSRQARYIGEVSEFEDVAQLMRIHGVKTTVVDALPETRKAREFQEGFPRGKIWLAYYTSQKVGSKKESEMTWDTDELTVNIDRTRALDATLSLFTDAARGEPGNTLPGNAKDIPDYYTHLKALERRLVTDANGNQLAVYVSASPDHYAHAENYLNMATEFPGMGTKKLGVLLQAKAKGW
jgi:hypothetical protein